MSGTALPPGWYDDQDGKSRYWDGTSWLVPSTQGLSSPPDSPKEVGPRWPMIAIISIVAVTVLGGGAYFVVMDQQDRRAAASAVELAEQEAEVVERAAEEERKATEAAASNLKAQEASEVGRRKEDVKTLENHVLKTAKERVTDGFYDEKVLDATCMPVTGSSIEELNEKSTTFSCMAVTKEKKGGTREGYTMSAVINWNTGEMTWG